VRAASKIRGLPAPAATATTPARLEVESVSKWFGATRALDGVSITLAPGEVHVLAGANGAGKSTLIRILSGVHAEFNGKLKLDGRRVRFRSPAEARAEGIATIHQELALVPSLSVVDNLLLGTRGGALSWLQRRAVRDHATRLLALVGLDIDVDREVSRLRLADRQLLEIARCFSEAARVFILDEPTSALSELEAERLFTLLSRLTESRASVIYISHRLPEIYRIADRISLLADGKLVFTRARAELPQAELVRAMAGRSLAPVTNRGRELERVAGPPLLAVRGLASPVAPSLEDIGFELARGEVLGLAGLAGSGASELLSALYGTRSFAGEVTLEGVPYRPRSPRQALARRVAFLPADRKDSVLAELSVEHNLTLTSLARHSRFGLVDRAAERTSVERGIGELGIKLRGLGAPARTLSGGNQQKLALLRCLLAEPALLLLDDPTRGVDVAAKAEIHERIRALAARGLGVLVYSSEPDELLALCDRVLVLFRGRVAAELRAPALSSEALQRALMGGSH
jgi:ribose transport system ATP-binding protein